MLFHRFRAGTPRLRVVSFLVGLTILTLAAALSCSSDPDTPLGSDFVNDALGSHPGDVFQDTIAVYADTVIERHTLISRTATIDLGRQDGYERVMILQPSFSGAGSDVNRVVASADLRLITADISGSFPARFYRLDRTYASSDTISTLDTLAVIPDPNTGSPNRSMQLFPATYALPPDLVQGWIRGDSLRTAIAIVYNDPVNDRIATFNSIEAESERPRIEVHFTDLTQHNYAFSADATFMRPPPPPSTLIVSDGYARRVYFRMHIDELAPQSSVHTARVRFHIVPGSVLGVNTILQMYVPTSTDPTSPDFLSGQQVTSEAFFSGDDIIEFKVTNSLFLTLQGSLEDNGFVLQFNSENTELRQVELYGSAAADSLRPRVYVTSSTPAGFTRP